SQLANAHPYSQWIERLRLKLESLPAPVQVNYNQPDAQLNTLQQAFGWTQEDLKFILQPMAEKGEEAIGSMGNDAPLTVLSDRSKPIYNYFRQMFAQVTNPPIDPIREQMVMSLVSFIGPKPNLLDINNVNPPLRLEVSQPILDPTAIAQIRNVEETTFGKFRCIELDITYPVQWGTEGIEASLAALCSSAADAVRSGGNILLLSDRNTSSSRLPIPALLATSAVHLHLIRQGLRTRTGLIVETGSAREVHHFALLGGYGAEAIHPYLDMETLDRLESPEKAIANYIKAVGKGLMKTMSKMGISTYMSYTGAQIFEAVGLHSSLIDAWFTGTPSPIQGLDILQVAEEVLRTHRNAYRHKPSVRSMLDQGGEYAFRTHGEQHMWSPDAVAKLQHAARSNSYAT